MDRNDNSDTNHYCARGDLVEATRGRACEARRAKSSTAKRQGYSTVAIMMHDYKQTACYRAGPRGPVTEVTWLVCRRVVHWPETAFEEVWPDWCREVGRQPPARQSSSSPKTTWGELGARVSPVCERTEIQAHDSIRPGEVAEMRLGWRRSCRRHPQNGRRATSVSNPSRKQPTQPRPKTRI